MIEKIISASLNGFPKPTKSSHESPVFNLIRSKIEEMSATQKKMAHYILENANEVINMSISELSQNVGVKSESSVVRFYRLLGFNGYHDFKVTLATDIAGTSFYKTFEDITMDDHIKDVMEKFFRSAAQTFESCIRSVPIDLLQEASELIDNSKRLILLGYGTSEALVSTAAFRFLRLGIPCFHSPDPHTNAVTMANPQEGDIIFAVSNSGETKDVVIPLQQAKPTAKVIALTGSPKSQLAAVADVPLVVDTSERAYRTDAMIARLVYDAIISVLYIDVAIRREGDSLEKLKNSRKALNYLKY